MEFYKAFTRRSAVQVILQAIQEYGPLSKRDLQRITGFSWAHISPVTNRLLEEGYIVTGEKQSTAGRKADKFDINREDNYCIGIDLSNQNLLVLITDMKGRVIEKSECHWNHWNQKQVLEKLYEIMDGLVGKYKDRHIRGIGLAIQGTVDISQGISVYIEGIEDWENVSLKTLLEERYHMDVILAHDPDCLMKCEESFGVLHDHPATDVLLVHWNHGVGIGMSVMINGQIYLGYHGRAGEIGYTILNAGAETPCIRLNRYTGKDVETMDVERLCNSIARSVAIANSLFNPEQIILHTMDCVYQEQLYRHIEMQLWTNSYDKEVKLQLSDLGRDAKAKGAALIMIDRAIDSLHS